MQHRAKKRSSTPFKSKAEWKEIGGKRIFFRSKMEFRYALLLQYMKDANEILDWKHEPQTFYFEGIRRGVTNYKPDYKVYNLDGTHFWVEVKGWLDPKSKTKLKRFKKYFPQEKLILVSKC